MKLSERAYLKLSAALPPGLAARTDMMRSTNLAGASLNGQRQRRRIVRDLLDAVEFDEVVETGTFRGASTEFFSHASGLPVHSVELLPRFFRYARARCAQDPDIHLTQGDSRGFLTSLSVRPGEHTTLFYLDAHWESDVPRLEEIEIISATWKRAVVMIDDFAVTDDPGYGFTYYGGKPLTVDYLPVLPGWARFHPMARSAEETGARRGCIVLASPELTAAVEKVPTLRRISGPAQLQDGTGADKSSYAQKLSRHGM